MTNTGMPRDEAIESASSGARTPRGRNDQPFLDVMEGMRPRRRISQRRLPRESMLDREAGFGGQLADVRIACSSLRGHEQ